MKWLEIIALRSGQNTRHQLQEVLDTLREEASQDPAMPQVRIYEHQALDGDYSIHLQHEGSQPDAHGSVPGMSIAESLRAFGLVNHHIWCEVQYNENLIKETS